MERDSGGGSGGSGGASSGSGPGATGAGTSSGSGVGGGMGSGFGPGSASSTSNPSQPPSSGFGGFATSSTSSPGEGKRRRLEGVIPDILKRAVEIGVEKATEAPDTIKALVTDLKLPKEVASLLLSQMEDTKNGLFRVVAKEMRDFLEHTNLAGEMQKMLTTLQFEINTTIRFTPNGSGPANGTTPPPSENGESNDKRSTPPTDAPPSSATPLPVVPVIPEVKTDVSITTRDLRPKRRSRE